MTIRDALKAAEKTLLEADVPDARLDAEYLLAGVLDAPRLLVCLSGETPLPPDHEVAFFSLIERRKTREPLQYILGTQVFMGFTFLVTPDVLIPRADTETLCEQALLYADENRRVLDLCTGSGALAVSIKRLSPACSVTATDISEKALAIARENAATLEADIEFLQGDLFSPLQGRRFDIILSNPPYIPNGELDTLQAEVQKEPRAALAGGTDGLDFYREIAQKAPSHLEKRGMLLLEIGETQGDAVRALLSPKFDDIKLIHDLSGRPRVVSARLKGETA